MEVSVNLTLAWLNVGIRINFSILTHRNCRYSLIPSPIDPAIVRNFTLLAVNSERLENVKKQLQSTKLIKEMMAENLNGTVEEIIEIDDNFKRVLFAEWIEGNDKDFQPMKKKLHENIESHTFSNKVILENNMMNNENITKKIGSLITPVKLNDTTNLNVAIPSQIRHVLFKGWETLGIDFIRVLLPYTRSLELDINLYMGKDKIVFHPPVPTYDKSRGFIYKNWSKNYCMLTVDILKFQFFSLYR